MGVHVGYESLSPKCLFSLLTFAHVLTGADHDIVDHVQSVDVSDVTRSLTEHGALVRLGGAGPATGAHLDKIIFESDEK